MMITNKILTSIFMLLLLSLLSACKKTDYCQKYNQDLNLLKVRGEEVKARLEMKLSAAPEAAKSFDPKWFYLDLNQFILPLPNRPRTLEKKENSEDMTVNAKTYVAVIGDDTLKGLPDHIESYFKSNNINTDYDYNAFIFSDDLLQCQDIKDKKDLMAKTTLASAKSLRAPFEISEAFKIDDANIIAIHGTQNSKNKFVTHFFVKVDQEHSKTILFYFQTKEMQDKFHSYLAKLSDKDFFKKGKILNF